MSGDSADYQDWKPGDPISYITPDIPEFDVPAYSGERYEAIVPDTLDLSDRAALAIHGMTEPTNPLADYEVYWIVHFRTSPPMMEHRWDDTSITPKFQEAVSLLRIMSGSAQNPEVERRWMEVMLKQQGPDGLAYIPVRGRPWAHRGNREPWFHRVAGLDHWVRPFTNGRVLSTMSLFALRDGSSLWRDAARRLVDGLADLAVDDGQRAYFWPSPLFGERVRPADVSPPGSHRHHAESSRVPHGLVHTYRVIGYEPALELARKMIVYLRDFYTPEGAFLCYPGQPQRAHFHAHAHGLQTMADYALEADDQEMMEFVLKSYDWAKTQGDTLVGYFPEHVNSPEWEASEICEVGDMIALALILSTAGVRDCWDDADRWTRNMFAEGQLLSTDWIYRLSETGGMVSPNPRPLLPTQLDPVSQVTDRVPERNLGAFAGWPAANDWFVGDGPGIMHCCTANGARALYYIWENILHHGDGTLRVNLLLNRASPWADVDSYIPYLGRVDVKMKESADLKIRIPEWVTPGETRCQVNGEERSLNWDGRYAQVGKVGHGDVAVLTFPISERTDVVQIEKQRFTLVRKGNEVVFIDPPGRYCPLYQRQHYRVSTPRKREVTRFVSSEHIIW